VKDRLRLRLRLRKNTEESFYCFVKTGNYSGVLPGVWRQLINMNKYSGREWSETVPYIIQNNISSTFPIHSSSSSSSLALASALTLISAFAFLNKISLLFLQELIRF